MWRVKRKHIAGTENAGFSAFKVCDSKWHMNEFLPPLYCGTAVSAASPLGEYCFILPLVLFLYYFFYYFPFFFRCLQYSESIPEVKAFLLKAGLCGREGCHGSSVWVQVWGGRELTFCWDNWKTILAISFDILPCCSAQWYTCIVSSRR